MIQSSGTTNSLNLIIPTDNFKVVSGETLKWQRKGSSGGNVTYNNCAKCAALLFVEADSVPTAKIVKLGTVDDEDVLQKSRPVSEIWTKHRLSWCPGWEGVPQTEVQ